MYLIGIDIGTGSTKAVAVSTSGKILFTSQFSYPTLNPKPSYCEQSPEVIWEAFVKCINTITGQLKESPQAICLSSAMHSVIPVDKTGDALMNMIIWADNRSASVARQIRQSPFGQSIYEHTGTPIHSMTPLCKIVWLKENDKFIFSKTWKFISIKEYIWYKLFQKFEIDYSIASATGLFNIQELKWHDEALLLCEIKPDKLSAPVPTVFSRRGMATFAAQLLRIPADTPCIIGSSDGCLANLGTFAIRPGLAALTIGTSGAIRTVSENPVCNYETMPFNYRLDEKIFITGGPINNGGVALKWYAENFLNLTLSGKNDYATLLQQVNEVKAGCHGLLFLPYILGERAPIWNSESCGVFFGITSRHKQIHFTRAVLEGICMALYQIGKTLEDGGLPIEEINVSGGFVQSREWLQILADIFGKKIKLINTEDASAIGATFLGMKALGIIKEYSQLGDTGATTFFPNENNHMVYQKNVFPRFVQLYKTLVNEMTDLHEKFGVQ